MLTVNDWVTLIVGFGVPYIMLFAWIIVKLGKHDTALALLIQQVNPPGDKSLRELLHDIQLEQVRITSPPSTGS